ncbi:MAG: phospho-sugar mutase [Acidimicrobiales bacterium]
MSPIDPALAARVAAWIAGDPDAEDRNALADRLDAAEAGSADAAADLADRFAGLLHFGTAGLRGPLGAGPARMNLAVVTLAAAGIVAWLRGGGPEAAAQGVVIGRDARHGSEAFAERTAAILAAAGIRALVLPGPQPTPLVPATVLRLGAAAGVVVTASHNPATDNGYKVYDRSGRQIVAPVDATIAEAMASSGRACDVPYARPEDPDIVRLGTDVVDAYVADAVALLRVPAARRARLAYTPLHGVGGAVARQAFAAAGFDDVVVVAEQADPDPDFPTVAFPNPEEPGALDAGLALARRSGASVLLANDPDADRLGVAVPDPGAAGGWRALRGDEIGPILADHLLRHGGIEPGGTFATTIVSSSLLDAMAADAGVPCARTLTGFKWIGRAPGPREHLAFGYEEALGFCVGGLAPDKDGITAALLLAEAVADLAASGQTVLDVLARLALAHGLHHTEQRSVRVAGIDGLAQVARAMAQLRAAPPEVLAGRQVRRVVDLLDASATDHEALGSGALPSADVVVLVLDGARLTVRPSGTEPKLKCYVEVVAPVADLSALDGARAAAAVATGELLAGVLEALDLDEGPGRDG